MNQQTSLASFPGSRIRPERHYTYLKMAQAMAERSTCRRAQVGCIITDTKGKIIASGYNGNPPGMPHCIDKDCLLHEGHCISTLHAEMNALSRFLLPENSGDLICYCTHSPCISCLKVGVTKRVMNWIYLSHYDDVLTYKFVKWYNDSTLKHYELQLRHVRMDDDSKSIVG